MPIPSLFPRPPSDRARNAPLEAQDASYRAASARIFNRAMGSTPVR